MVNDTLSVSHDELFIQPSSDSTPERHPSILRPGGHSSPLNHPAVLRPGPARRSRTPSPSGDAASTPRQNPAITASPPPVIYKAYSPARPQSPNDELSAEIEGYFTALEVPPLHISKPSSPPAVPLEQQRCASPPVPPKERIPAFELLDASKIPGTAATAIQTPQEGPPAYDESSRVKPPPEKPDSHRLSAPATQADEASEESLSPPAEPPVVIARAAPNTINETQSGTCAASSGNDDNLPPPPPLPPRPIACAVEEADKGKGKDEDPSIQTTGAFPPPPTHSAPSSSYKFSGAAATSAASVGAAVAGMGQSPGIKQARKAFEKRIGHIIDKAKEHHRAGAHEKKPSTSRNPSAEGPTKKKGTSTGVVAEVSTDHSYGIRLEAECIFV